MVNDERFGRAARYMDTCDYEYHGDGTNNCAIFECKCCGHQPTIAGDGGPDVRLCPVTYQAAAKRLREVDNAT